MFPQLFLFELKYRLKRPAAYLYFGFFFFVAFTGFANGALPVQENEFYNAPAMLALYAGMVGIFMMLPSSAIMGTPLYRDIEHNTKDYYLSYPITKAGYFWGRFWGSFVFVLLIGSSVFLGAWAGTLGGPFFGWSGKEHYQSFHFYHYLYPYLTILLPDLFFMSALFFGLVAVFRNVKVIYSSALLLFLGYLISNFFLHNVNNPTVIYLWDPFAFTPLRMITGPMSPATMNGSLILVRGLLLENRILWTSIGAVILLGTYLRFSFGRFFGGQSRRRWGHSLRQVKTLNAGGSLRTVSAGVGGGLRQGSLRQVKTLFTGGYSRKVLYTLTRIEILNIIRDNYFWIIMAGGLSFLGFLFWSSFSPYDVPDLPRSSFFMAAYMDQFGFFLFFILMFYTGETVHRERLTRYAFINDSLPPPNWVLGTAKVFSLLVLAIFFALVPMVLGLAIQLLKGYHQFAFPVYFTNLFVLILPKLVEMVLFCYAVQIVAGNKFAGYAIGILLWVFLWVVDDQGYFTYLLLLYGSAPYAFVSDMDLAGHMLKPLLWFHGYWLLAGGCLLVLASLFFIRGTSSHFTETLRLVRERYRGRLRLGSLVLLAGYLAIGIYIYYNVSVMNFYLTNHERDQRKVLMEKELKHFEPLPVPTVVRLRLQAELFPEKQEQLTHAWITLRNDERVPIDTLLLDKDNIEDYTLKISGRVLPYRSPLSYPGGKFNFLRPARDSSDYRLYVLRTPLLPGDTTLVELQSRIVNLGFRNESYGHSMLYNGTVYEGGLPGAGYDDGDELRNNEKRKGYGLPPRIDPVILHNDPDGMRHLDAGNTSSLTPIDITVGTSGDQWAVGPGRLEREWMENGRHYFHYVQQEPGIYPPFMIFSARYARRQDTVAFAHFPPVRVTLFYHPAHSANLDRLMAANKDGLRYMSEHFGPYPSGDFSFAESPVYAPNYLSFPGGTAFSEHFGWNAHFTGPKQTDYLYYKATEMLAHQWWEQQVAPNHTTGSPVISKGLSQYIALLLVEKKYGKEMLTGIRTREQYGYLFYHRRESRREHPLLYARDDNESGAKTAIVLYGLQDLIGQDSLTAALKEFHDAWAFRRYPPYAGSEDLYRVLQKHVPDSFRYYLTDTWEKVCFYDNNIVEARTEPAAAGSYRLTVKVFINKVYYDSAKQEHPATGMKDYIDLGVYGEQHKELYLEKLLFSEGEHTIELLVPGKPVSVAIDPERKLMDRLPEDNRRMLIPKS